MMNDKICVELDVSCCGTCPFLNCSDTGEDCRLLTNEIQEEEFSNIAFKFEKGWRYEKCPLVHPQYLRDTRHVSVCSGKTFDKQCEMLFEWESAIIELSGKEFKHYELKEEYYQKSEDIIASTDFKVLYGKNNETVRKNHVKKELACMVKDIKGLEFSINYLKRRIDYLKVMMLISSTIEG